MVRIAVYSAALLLLGWVLAVLGLMLLIDEIFGL